MLIYWSFQVLCRILQWSKLLSISVSTLKNIMAPSLELCFYFNSESFWGTWSNSLCFSFELPLRQCQRLITPSLCNSSGAQEFSVSGRCECWKPKYCVSCLLSHGPFPPIPLCLYRFLLISPQRRLCSFRGWTLERAYLESECNWSCQSYDCVPNLQRFHFQSEGKNNSATQSNESKWKG